MSRYRRPAVAEVLYRTPLPLPQPHTSLSSQKPVSSSEYFLFGMQSIASLESCEAIHAGRWGIARLDNTFEAFIDIVTTNIYLLTNSSDLPTMLPHVAKNTRQNATRCSSTDVGGFVGLCSLICLLYNSGPDHP